MPRRYSFLNREYVFEAFNRVRDAFLAAKDGEEVNKIISSLLTFDEKLKLGRRIQIAEALLSGMTYSEIMDHLKVGKSTITRVDNKLLENKEGYDLIFKRGEKVEKEFKEKAYRKVGGSKLLHKYTVYTGFKRKDVKR